MCHHHGTHVFKLQNEMHSVTEGDYKNSSASIKKRNDARKSKLGNLSELSY